MMKFICQSCGCRYDKLRCVTIEPITISMITEITCSWDDVLIDKNVCWDCFVKLRDFIRRGKYVVICDTKDCKKVASKVTISVAVEKGSSMSGLVEIRDLCAGCLENLKTHIADYLKKNEQIPS